MCLNLFDLGLLRSCLLSSNLNDTGGDDAFCLDVERCGVL